MGRLESYVTGCVPADHHAVLARYEGSLIVKAKMFVSAYCSHLASSNESGFDKGRLQSLQTFLGVQCQETAVVHSSLGGNVVELFQPE